MSTQQNQPRRDDPTVDDGRVHTADETTAHDRTAELDHGTHAEGEGHGRTVGGGTSEDLEARMRRLEQRFDEQGEGRHGAVSAATHDAGDHDTIGRDTDRHDTTRDDTARDDTVRTDTHDSDAAAGWSTNAVPDVTDIKTSPAAVFSLVFGLSALLCALALILSPLAVLFGLIGLVLGIIGRKHGKRPDLTGAGVATGGLVMSVLGLLLGIGVITGAATFLSNSENIDSIETQLEELRDALPTTVPEGLTS
jgi:hypothetical protein